MSGKFDPYHVWLGIPPAEQPPHHYRLLGIAPLESDRAVIEAAADRQMTFLRQHGAGEHGDESQRILNEVSKALVELLNPARKAAYDERLKQRLDRSASGKKEKASRGDAAAAAAFAAFEDDFVASPATADDPAQVRTNGKKAAVPTPLIAVAGVGALAVIAGLIWISLPDKSRESGSPEKIVQAGVESTDANPSPASKSSDLKPAPKPKPSSDRSPPDSLVEDPSQIPLRVAQWTLSVGGQVVVAEGEARRAIATGQPLPRGSLQLVEVHLPGSPQITSQRLASLKGLKQIDTLVVSGNLQIGDREMELFGGLTSLKSLILDRTGVTDDGLKSLAGLKGLQALSLNGTKVTGTGFAHLTGFNELHTLAYTDVPVSNAAMAHLKNFPRLRALSIYRCELDDEGLRSVGQLPELTDLRISGANVTSAGLAHLAGLKQLGSLHVSQSGVTSDGLAHLTKLDNLRDLRIWQAPVDDDVWKHVAALKSLQSFGAVETAVTGKGIGGLKFPKLTVLELTGSKVDDAGLKEIETLEGLQILVLNDTSVTDAGIPSLGKLSGLRTLTLGGVAVRQETLAALRRDLPSTQIVAKASGAVPSAGPASSGVSAPLPAIAPFDANRARSYQELWAQYLGVPATHVNAVGIRFQLIPPGEYSRGSSDTNANGDPAEKPQHRVRITKPFYLGAAEVTQKQYEEITGQTPSFFRPGKGGAGRTGRLDLDKLPVDHVSWNDCVKYCELLQAKDPVAKAGAYRLPTDAEWEYACRAGTVTRWSFGDTEEGAEKHLVVQRTGDRTHSEETASLTPNPWGLFDMHGNVFEWCADEFRSDAFAPFRYELAVNPFQKPEGNRRVARGGSWDLPIGRATSSTRLPLRQDELGQSTGFRIAFSLNVPPASFPENIAGERHEGMVGRIELDGKDAGLLASYLSSRSFGQKELKSILPLYDHLKQKIRIELNGAFELAAPEKVLVRQLGGSPRNGTVMLFVDGMETSVVGSKGDKEFQREIPLAAGVHEVRWVLSGGWLGTTNAVDVRTEKGEIVPLFHTEAMASAARQEKNRKAALTNEADKPLSDAKP